MASTSSIAMQSLGKIVQRAISDSLHGRCENVVFVTMFVTGRIAVNRQTAVLNLLTGQKSGFSLCRGDSYHLFRSNFAGPTGTWVRLAVQNFTSIGAGGGNAAQNIKNFHFLVKSRHAGATPLTDFENF